MFTLSDGDEVLHGMKEDCGLGLELHFTYPRLQKFPRSVRPASGMGGGELTGAFLLKNRASKEARF